MPDKNFLLTSLLLFASPSVAFAHAGIHEQAFASNIVHFLTDPMHCFAILSVCFLFFLLVITGRKRKCS